MGVAGINGDPGFAIHDVEISKAVDRTRYPRDLNGIGMLEISDYGRLAFGGVEMERIGAFVAGHRLIEILTSNQIVILNSASQRRGTTVNPDDQLRRIGMLGATWRHAAR